MADESTNGTATADPTPVSTGGQEAKGSWFDRAFRPFTPRQTETPSPSATHEEPASEPGAAPKAETTPAKASSPAAPTTTPLPTETPEASKTVTLTEAELQDRVSRAAQAEADRRERVRQSREAEAKRRQQRENLRGLLDTDTQAAAEVVRQSLTEEEQEEQRQGVQAQMNTMLTSVRDEFDTNVIRPVLSRLPKEEMERIVRDAPAGIDGRRIIVESAIEAIVKAAEQRGELNARQNLRKDPAFKKQVLVDVRGEEDEPDAPAAVAPPAASNRSEMSRMLRQMAGYEA